MLVARCLALDALAARAVAILTAAGVEVQLIKGPATVAWLYADIPGRRNYSDIDLLVPPTSWGAAARALRGAGLRDHLSGFRSSEVASRHERTITDGPLKIDLHRSFHSVREPERFWRDLATDPTTVAVAGRRVPTPGPAGAALIYALHAAVNGGNPDMAPKPLLDLARAVRRFDDDTWVSAATIAERAGALDAFRVGLALAAPHHPALGYGGRISPQRPLVTLRAGTPPRGGDLFVAHMVEERTWSDRAVIARDALIPSPARMRTEFQVEGSANLVLAYARRCVAAPPRAVRGTWRHWRAGRPTRTVPWVARRLASAVARPDPSQVLTLMWVANGLLKTRAQLMTGQPPGVELPPPRGCGSSSLRLRRTSSVRRLLRSMRASCLEECVVTQRWLAAAGEQRTLVVGVRQPGADFVAHAWLEGDRVPAEFTPLTRYEA